MDELGNREREREFSLQISRYFLGQVVDLFPLENVSTPLMANWFQLYIGHPWCKYPKGTVR